MYSIQHAFNHILKKTSMEIHNYPRPLPELLEGEELYEVETILKCQQRGRRY
jgi:hypothetical protein